MKTADKPRTPHVRGSEPTRIIRETSRSRDSARRFADALERRAQTGGETSKPERELDRDHPRLPRERLVPEEDEPAPDVTAMPGHEPLAVGAFGRSFAEPKAEGATQSTRLTPQFDRIIQEIAVAQDAHRRRVISLRLEVPGRGALRVRIRRVGHGTEVRFAADPGLLEEVRRRETELTDRARARGVDIARVLYR